MIMKNYDMDKKVLMLLPNGFSPDPRVYHEARTLVNNGYEVRIIAWDREATLPKNATIDGIKIERIHVKSIYGRGTGQLFFVMAFWIQVFIRAMQKDFDIIHCHDFNTLPIGLLIGKLRRKKIIFDAHESYCEMLEANVSSKLKKIMYAVEGVLIKHIDLLITVGEILETEYKRRGANTTCVVGNWKSLSEYCIKPEEIISARKQMNISDRLVVTYIGYLINGRGIFQFIDAVKMNNSIFAIIGGKGELAPAIEKQVKNVENILYLGFVNPDRIPFYTALSDVIYYGLEGKEINDRYSAPNKLFEALATGKAIITGNYGEIAKIVQQENCGLVVNSITAENINNASSTISQNGTLSRFQSNAKAAAMKKYNWANAEKTLLSCYKNLL